MARPKKAAAKPVAEVKPKEKKIVMTKEQYQALVETAEKVAEARRLLQNVDESESIAAISFIAGRIYAEVNSVEDTLDDLVNDLNPEDSVEFEY